MKFNANKYLFLAICTLIVMSSALSSCGMKRALYLPEKKGESKSESRIVE